MISKNKIDKIELNNKLMIKKSIKMIMMMMMTMIYYRINQFSVLLRGVLI